MAAMEFGHMALKKHRPHARTLDRRELIHTSSYGVLRRTQPGTPTGRFMATP
jgi:hypothetical protein